MEEDIKKIKIDISEIKERNKRVELDKRWETSMFRRVSLVIITYIVILIFL